MYYLNVLEQFYIELCVYDSWKTCTFIFLILFLSGLYLYEVWFCLIFFSCVTFCLFLVINTSNFILLIYLLISFGLFFEMLSPILEPGYYILIQIFFFILAKTREHLGGVLQAYYIFLLGTALILGFFNVIGLLPFTTVLTGQFIFAFCFSIKYFIVNMICGVLYHHVEVFNLFLPRGVPFFIIPLLIIIESISFFSRVFSLAIRLFANIVAGHILLKILVSFLDVIFRAHISFVFPIIISLIGIIIIIVLEVFINLLQIYIFNLLLLIYINGVIALH